MKTAWRRILKHPAVCILFTFLLGLPFLSQTQDASEEIQWHTDYGYARGLAAAENKPLLVSFRCVP